MHYITHLANLTVPASLLEGLEESFTVNRLKLTPALIRCLASTFLQAEKSFRRIQGHRDLWVLAVALGREQSAKKVDAHAKAA